MNFNPNDLKQSLDKLMQEAGKMKDKMEAAQKELVELLVEGKAGGVSLDMNGAHYVKKVRLTDEVLEEDKRVIEDLIAAAINDAVNKIEKRSKDKISQLTAGLKLPPDFQIPTDQDSES